MHELTDDLLTIYCSFNRMHNRIFEEKWTVDRKCLPFAEGTTIVVIFTYVSH